jgi:hypothetical protein
MDEEYAEMILNAQEKGTVKSTGGGPSMTTWTPEHGALAMVIDKLSVLIEINKSKPGQVIPYARPQTALDKVRFRRQQKKHESIVAMVLPGKAQDKDE